MFKIGLALALCFFLGCGSDSTNPADKFTGIWSGISTGTLVCSDGSSSPVAPKTGQIVITQGTASDLVRASTTAAMVCPCLLNISGNRATLATPATCTDGNGGTLSITAWTLTLSAHNAAAENGSGTAAIAGVGSCAMTLATTLTR